MARARYELKFPISLAQKLKFVKEVCPGVVADTNGVCATYRVSSMYFDTADLRAYWQKMDGEAVRSKIRLRYYTAAAENQPRIQTAFMEIKHRLNDLVLKERVQLTDEGANTILADVRELVDLDRHVIANIPPAARTTVERIQRAASAPNFSAVNVISYLREAWEGSVDRRLRLTFDSSCQAYAPQSYLDVAFNCGTRILREGEFIMEVKFDEAIPRWIRDLVARNGLHLQRFSKYAYGVERLRIRGQTGVMERLNPFERSNRIVGSS